MAYVTMSHIRMSCMTPCWTVWTMCVMAFCRHFVRHWSESGHIFHVHSVVGMRSPIPQKSKDGNRKWVVEDSMREIWIWKKNENGKRKNGIHSKYAPFYFGRWDRVRPSQQIFCFNKNQSTKKVKWVRFLSSAHRARIHIKHISSYSFGCCA